MESQTYYPRKVSLWQHLLIVVGGSTVGGLLVGSIVYYLIIRDFYSRFLQDDRPPTFLATFLIVFAFFAIMNTGICIWASRSKMRLERQGDELFEFDRKGRIVARGTPGQILFIESVKILGKTAYILRFANGSFLVLGSAYPKSEELHQFVFTNTDVKPVERKIKLQALGEEIRKRRILESKTV